MYYNKQFSKNTRGTYQKSPRDHQARASKHSYNATPEMVEGLLEKIAALTEELSELKAVRSSSGEKKYTDAEFNDAVVKAIDKELSSLGGSAKEAKNKQKAYEDRIAQVQAKLLEEVNKNKELEDKLRQATGELAAALIRLEAKDETIAILKDKPVQAVVQIDGSKVAHKPSQHEEPQENAPSIDGAFIDPTDDGVEMESHINVKSDSGSSQLDKLKKLKDLGFGG